MTVENKITIFHKIPGLNLIQRDAIVAIPSERRNSFAPLHPRGQDQRHVSHVPRDQQTNQKQSNRYVEIKSKLDRNQTIIAQLSIVNDMFNDPLLQM